jgi:chromosome partitioning protein
VADDSPGVFEGLGWPQATEDRAGNGERRLQALGWPEEPVSRETVSHADRPVSRETVGEQPERDTGQDQPEPLGENVVTEQSVDRPPARGALPGALPGAQGGPGAASASEASRFGPHPAPGSPYRTAAELAQAADLAASGVQLAPPGMLESDESTPLARSVEHALLVREGRRLGGPLPRPEHTRVMVVANQKGGVGKTTTTVNLAAALAQHGLRVLVVDLDPQGNASTALSVEHRRGTPSTYDAVVDAVPLTEIVVASEEVDGLWVVPATIDLAGAEIELVSLVARESRLRKALHAHPQVCPDPAIEGGAAEDRFDYVLIDCPPSLGLLTLNALVAGDEMLIPIQAEYYALEGLGQLLETVEMVRAHLNPDLEVSTILLTMYDARTRLSAGVADEVREHFGAQVLRTAIPRSVRISEAPSYGQTVMTYDPASPGALSYLEAAREMAERVPGATTATAPPAARDGEQ